MREIDTFSPHDGHIESVVIGIGQAKVSFQTWDCRELVLVFDEAAEVGSRAVLTDISNFTVAETEHGGLSYTFLDAWDEVPVLCIAAKSLKIYEAGQAQREDTALFNVGTDYLGGQSAKT